MDMQPTRDRIKAGQEIRLDGDELELVATYQPVHHNWLVEERNQLGVVASRWLLDDAQLEDEVQRRVAEGWLAEY